MLQSNTLQPDALLRRGAAAPVMFALDGAAGLGVQVARAAGVALGQYEVRDFDRGERLTGARCAVRGRDVAVLQAVHGELAGPSANDRLMQLWLFIAALKDAGAASVTALVPYLPYSRQDRRTQSGDPVSSRYIAQHFEAASLDTLISLEPHNIAAFENAFRCPALAIPMSALVAGWSGGAARTSPWTVVSPDAGGIKRAQLVCEQLQREWQVPVGFAAVQKRRGREGISGGQIAGEVAGHACLIVDDLVSTGSTLAQAAASCRAAGAVHAEALVAHGLFLAGAGARIADAGITPVTISDSVAGAMADGAPALVQCVPSAALLGAALRHVWTGEAPAWLDGAAAMR